MFVEDVFKTGPRHCSPLGVHEQLGHGRCASNRQPGTEIGRGFLPERKASFPSALAENTNARCSFEGTILQREPHQFGDSQSSREAEMQHGAVADSWTGSSRWRVEDGTNLFDGEMPHQRLVMAFARDGMDLPRLFKCGGHAEFDIPDEGFDYGEPSIARNRAVAAVFLDVSEKAENQICVDLFDADLGGLDTEPLAGKNEQELKGMSVGLARVGAATLRDRHVFAQELVIS